MANSASASPTLAPGRMLGAFQLVERAGAGGMAEVWRALQPDLGRHVAIKVLPRHLAMQPGYLDRFRQEALAITRLDHPNILTVHAFGDQDGLTYMVTPFLGGGTLDRQLARPWSLTDTLRLAAPVASALDYAHARGVVHRDVKPSNVLFTDQGRPILGDFGIARLLDGAPEQTLAGTVLGTPLYMSPEQVRGAPAGPASDLYSFGVMLFQLLTGRLPFDGSTPIATARAHLSDPVPAASSMNPDLPPTVDRILTKALAKDPTDRYPTCGALVEALATTVWRESPGHTPSQPTPTPAGRPRVALAAGLVLLLVAATLGLIRDPSSSTLPIPSLLSALRPAPTAAASSARPASGAAEPATPTMQAGRLVRADDFSDPPRGLFRDNQEGVERMPFADGRTAEYRWQYRYQDQSLALRLLGPYPDNPARALPGVGAVAAERLLDDFAVEVTARSTQSPAVGLYGLRYVLAPGDSCLFRVNPVGGSYDAWSEQAPGWHVGGRSSAINREGQPNQLRLELQGDTLRVFANGRLLDRTQQPGLARRGGQLNLIIEMSGPPADGDLEVRFTNLKIYSLTP